jgi:hypothetical protein
MLPDLSVDDIMMFLEQAREITGNKAEKAPLPSLNGDSKPQASFAETDAQAKTGAQAKAADAPPIAYWMYMNQLEPPLWLRFNLSSLTGMPTTRPPPVPKMLPPPPPVLFPEFAYTRPMAGPYAPPRTAVPAYSMSAPPPVPAAQWVPLSAYIQPPGDTPDPELISYARSVTRHENSGSG